MPTPTEHKTACLCVPARSLAGGSARRRVQARILRYAQEIGWMYVPRIRLNGGAALPLTPTLSRKGRENPVRARKASLFFGGLMDQVMTAQIRLHELD